MEDRVIDLLAKRFPQLVLPVSEGISQSKAYKDAVLRGHPLLEKPVFVSPDQISVETVATLAGNVEVILFLERKDFLHAYRALGYRCEPVAIPDSVGACIIDGVADWGKIRKHRKVYEAAGYDDWSQEFRRFTSVRENYRSMLILLSGGFYSAVSPETIGQTKEEWTCKSILIRKYHELCHFVCRKLWPEKKDALRDEVYADCIGLIAAFGNYDAMLARTFLGIEGEQYRKTGRLLHYAGDDPDAAYTVARDLIREASEKLNHLDLNSDIWQVLSQIY